MKIYLSTGEKSGELHAASLARELLLQSSGLCLDGMGGEILRAAGVNTIVDPTALSVTGIIEVLGKLGKFRNLLTQCAKHIEESAPDAVVLVDYPGFHFKLAERLRKSRPGLKIFYYISPKFWAWNYQRVKKMRSLFDQVLCIFPFEPPMLASEGVPATFVGNPLLDQLDFTLDRQGLRAQFDVAAGNRLVSIFPGSRAGEIKRILPVFLSAAARLQKEFSDLEFRIAAAPGYDAEALRKISGFAELPYAIIEGRNRELMAASDFALAKSGTTTLELALYGVPMVVAYLMSPVSGFLAKRVLRTRHFGLPNLLSDDFCAGGKDAARELVPELLQGEATPERVFAEATKILADESARKTLSRELSALRHILGDGGASARAAKLILGNL